MKCITSISLVYTAIRKGPREASESRYSSWANVSYRPSLTDTFGIGRRQEISKSLCPRLSSLVGSGHIHGLYICLQFSAPCVSWSASFPLALRVSCLGLAW